MGGDAGLDASGVDDTGLCLCSFFGFEEEAIDSARALAAVSFEPNISVKTVSSKALTSIGLAHL